MTAMKDIQEHTKWQPTENMKRLAEALLGGGEGKKPIGPTEAASKAGIHRQTYYGYFKNPQFVAWFGEQRKSRAKAWGAVIDLSLINKAIKGDLNAIRMFYERFEEMIPLGQSGGANVNLHVTIDPEQARENVNRRIDRLAAAWGEGSSVGGSSAD